MFVTTRTLLSHGSDSLLYQKYIKNQWEPRLFCILNFLVDVIISVYVYEICHQVSSKPWYSPFFKIGDTWFTYLTPCNVTFIYKFIRCRRIIETTSRRRFGVIMTLLLRRVSGGMFVWKSVPLGTRVSICGSARTELPCDFHLIRLFYHIHSRYSVKQNDIIIYWLIRTNSSPVYNEKDKYIVVPQDLVEHTNWSRLVMQDHFQPRWDVAPPTHIHIYACRHLAAFAVDLLYACIQYMRIISTARAATCLPQCAVQATGLDAWASRVKCPARFVSYLHEICIYIYIYIWVVYSLCFFCCLFITVTWWYMWCFEWASGNQEEVQACLVTLWIFIISCYSLYKTTTGLLC